MKSNVITDCEVRALLFILIEKIFELACDQ